MILPLGLLLLQVPIENLCFSIKIYYHRLSQKSCSSYDVIRLEVKRGGGGGGGG